jgi:hypothetical protein
MIRYVYDFYPGLSRSAVLNMLKNPNDFSHAAVSDVILESLLNEKSIELLELLKLHPPSKAFLDFFKSGGNIQKEISDLEIDFKDKLSTIKQSYQEDRNFPIHYKSLAAKELFEKKRDKLKQVEERMKAIYNLLQ